MKKDEKNKIDWIITIVPFTLIVGLCGLFIAMPQQSNRILSQIRFFLGDVFGSYYIIMGIFFLGVSLYLVASKYGDIVLGLPGKNQSILSFHGEL